MEKNKWISYKTGLGEVILELIFYFIFVMLFFFSFYVSYWVGIYLFIILFLVFRKSNKILAINHNEMVILKYFFIKQRINTENIKKIYCKRTKLRFVSFVDVCVIFISNDKDSSAHFISYNFLGYINLLGLLNYFNDKVYIDKDSFKIINILYEENKFVSI